MWYFSALGQRPYRTLTRESELVRINDPLLVLGMCDLRIDEDYVPVVAEGSRVVLCGASCVKGEEGSALEIRDGRVFRLGSHEAQ